jgi:hypothetical protein
MNKSKQLLRDGRFNHSSTRFRLAKVESDKDASDGLPTRPRLFFEAHRLIEQFATKDFCCIGIFTDVGNDNSEVFVSRLKDHDDIPGHRLGSYLRLTGSRLPSGLVVFSSYSVCSR